MRRFVFLPLISILLLAPSLFAQDLNRLKTRVEDHWKFRIAGDKVKAAQFVDAGSRDLFASLTGAFEKAFRIKSFDFSPDFKEVLVTVKTHLVLPIAELDKDLAERWIWTGSNWFLRLEPGVGPVGTPFEFNKPTTQVFPGPPRVDFEIAESQLNLENHVQGEQVSGTVSFKGKKTEIFAMAVEGIPGLSVKEFRWKDDASGTIEFLLDTSSISTDLAQPVKFVAVGTMGVRTPSKPVDVLAKIEGRVQFTQVPDTIEFLIPGKFQLGIKNLTDRPIAMTAISVTHQDFAVLESEQVAAKGGMEIKPGESRSLTIQHGIEGEPTPVDVRITFAGNVFPQPAVFPIRFTARAADPFPAVDPAVLDQILRSRGKP